MDLTQATAELATNPLAQVAFALLSAFGTYRIYKNQSSGDAVTRASDAANLTGIETLKQLVESERAARMKAEERADKFAAERNEALQQVWTMKGQLEAMNQTLAANNSEITLLREQVRELKERVNASNS